MILLKKKLITLFAVTIMFFLLNAGQTAFAGVPNWERDLPNWDIVVTDDLGLVLSSNSGGYVIPEDAKENARHGFFEISNISPGGTKSSTITIESKCTFPFTLKMDVGCISGVEAGIDNNGNPVDVILAKQLVIRTFVNGAEIESSPGLPFPKNYNLTTDDFLPANITQLFPIPSLTDPHVDYKGAKLGTYTFPKISPGSKYEVKINIDMPGDYNPLTGDNSDNKYQGKSARFVWIFMAQPSGDDDDDDEDDDEKPGDNDADSDGDADTDTDTDIPEPNEPKGDFPDIPEPVDIVDPDVPLIPFLPKTGEVPLWHNLFPGFTLILLGVALLRRKKRIKDPLAE
jgi:hypothetical protein